jgi:flagellar protein FliS
MMQSRRGVAQYRTVSCHGLVADASPTRLVQIVYGEILTQLAIAQGCMQRISNNLPLEDVVAKCKAIGKAVRLINQLNATLDMERGGDIADNLRSLYDYMMKRLTIANLRNDPHLVAEVIELTRKIKSGWDQIVTDQR